MIRGFLIAWLLITLVSWTLLPMVRAVTFDEKDWRLHETIRSVIILAVLVIAYA
jgi:uncharacterized membrane protein